MAMNQTNLIGILENHGHKNKALTANTQYSQ